MSQFPADSGIRDNHSRGTVASFLTEKIQDGSTLSIVSAYFTIYAYDALKDSLDRIQHLDFLFGEPSFVNAVRTIGDSRDLHCDRSHITMVTALLAVRERQRHILCPSPITISTSVLCGFEGGEDEPEAGSRSPDVGSVRVACHPTAIAGLPRFHIVCCHIEHRRASRHISRCDHKIRRSREGMEEE